MSTEIIDFKTPSKLFALKVKVFVIELAVKCTTMVIAKL